MGDLADATYATSVVRYFAASYPMEAPDWEIYGSQLVILCTGRPKSLLKAMVNPVSGLLGKSKFLPSIAAVREWLDDNGPRPAPKPEIIPPDPRPSIEDREAQIRAYQAQGLIRKTAESRRAR